MLSTEHKTVTIPVICGIINMLYVEQHSMSLLSGMLVFQQDNLVAND